ncbi:MAG: hypothetical protein ACJ8AI_13715, partial [Rhodopila sp.]
LPLRVIIAGLLALVALCLLTPNGALDFGAIRATQAMPSRAAAFGVAAGIALLLPIAFRDGFPGSLETGLLIPTGIYILIRLLIDLPGPNVMAWSGYTLMLAGAGGGVAMGWRATGHPDLGGAVDALLRQYGAIAVLALGVCIVGKSSDLPETTCVGLAAAIMLALGGAGLAGTLASLGGSDLARGAGSWRLARLGGLIHTMPLASGVFAVSLLAFAPAPPGLAFAGIWLLLQALLSAPPTGGLIAQIPLIAATVAVAASAGLATATTVRLAGIAILGRPRSARASSALDITRPQAVILSALAGVVLVIGLLPGIMLRALAEPAIGMLSGTSLGARAGWTVLSAAPSMAGYASLPVFALLLLAAGGVVLVTRRYRSEQRLSTIWTGGLPPPTNLPFDVPMAQSAGTGFRPVLPHLPALSRPRLRLDPRPRLGLRAGIWVMLSGVSLLLLASSLAGSSGP